MSPETPDRRSRIGSFIGRLGVWSTAHGLIRLEEYLSDYVLYPYMLYRGGADALRELGKLGGRPGPVAPAAGYWFGFALLLAFSALVNLAYLRGYDATKRDWFGFEALRGWEARFITKRQWVAVRGPLRFAAFVYLSIWHSPLFGTLFIRSAIQPYSMTLRDWRVFWTALLLANLGWTAFVSGAVAVVRLVLAHVPAGAFRHLGF